MLAKERLLDILAPVNRGLKATELDRKSILAAIATLEDLNPTPRPLEALDKLEGDWRLLYTTSKELLNLERLPFFHLGSIYQCIRSKTNSVYNIAEISGLPYLDGIIVSCAQFAPIPQKRVEIKFQRSVIGLAKLIGYQSPPQIIAEIESGKKFTAIDFPISASANPGWLDITYIDADLRINRGSQGNVFVLTRV